MKTLLSAILGVNAKLRTVALLFLASVLTYNFPWLLSWLPPDLQSEVQKGVYAIMQGAVFFALFWAKQNNVSGNGTLDRPYEKPTPSGQSQPIE